MSVPVMTPIQSCFMDTDLYNSSITLPIVTLHSTLNTRIEPSLKHDTWTFFFNLVGTKEREGKEKIKPVLKKQKTFGVY